MLRDLAQVEAVLQDAHATGAINFVGTSYLEEASVADQVCIFSDVSILVGVHGQALANMLWMEPGSVLIELMHTEQWWYSDLARAKGIHFVGLRGNPPAPADLRAAVDGAVAAWRAADGGVRAAAAVEEGHHREL